MLLSFSQPMPNIIEFIEKYGKHNFLELKFNEVDSLILSQLAYLNFDLVLKDKTLLLRDFKDYSLDSKLYELVRVPDKNYELLQKLASSKRYYDLKISIGVSNLDESKEVQFAAVSFHLNEESKYIAYRGTDFHLVAWKEDLNMAFMPTIPAQRLALSYLQAAIQRDQKQIYVGGHSKGGNLAVYAASKLKKQEQARLITIYNHDGPGFHREAISPKQFKRIRKKLNKTVPQGAVFGLLLYDPNPYKIIKAKALGLWQHDPFNWQTSKHQFQRSHKLNYRARHTSLTISNLLLEVDEATQTALIETLYDFAKASQIKNVVQLKTQWQIALRGMAKHRKKLSPEQKAMFSKIQKAFFKSYRKAIWQAFDR